MKIKELPVFDAIIGAGVVGKKAAALPSR